MSDVTQPPVASGDVARTPFSHLILYLYQRRASGTLIVLGTDGEHRTLFHRGRAVAARVPQPMASLDESLLPLSALAAGAFSFHEADLVGSGCEVVTGMFDPLGFAVRAARLYARESTVLEVLARYGSATLTLDLALDISRLSLTAQELPLIAAAKERALSCEALVACTGLPTDLARRLVYSLLITGALRLQEANPAPAASVQSSSPAPRASTPGISAQRVTPTPGRHRSSDAWRAIASAAGAIAEGRRASDPGAPPQRSSRPDMSRVTPTAPTRPISGPLSATTRAAVGGSSSAPSRPISRPLSRPLSEPLTMSGAGSVSDSRPLGYPPARESSATGLPSARPSTPVPRSSPRPSLPDIETLDADGKFRRVELLCQRNAYHDALPIMRVLIEQDRKNAKYLGMLSHVLFGRTQDTNFGKELVECVNQALRIDPDQIHALYTKARCYKRMGKEREALHYFRRTLAVEPEHLEAAREARLLVSRLGEKRKR